MKKFTKEKYEDMAKGLKEVDYSDLSVDGIGSKYCDAEGCVIYFKIRREEWIQKKQKKISMILHTIT